MGTISYMTSLLTFYLKSEIGVERNALVFKRPNTWLGFIPMGMKTEMIPISQIAYTSISTHVRVPSLVLGFVILTAAFSGLSTTLLTDQGTPAVALLVLLIAAAFFIDAFSTNLVVTNSAGQRKSISFLIFEKNKAEEIERRINTMISGGEPNSYTW